ncbi:hypothetical protein [Nostoc sp.]|uniref:hypothetical protein n=1 Tax=Nostoc sp. TaxID=1180 RepID=UPI003FA5D6F8
MVIKLLKFKVAPDLREDIIQKNAQIWTTVLAEYPGLPAKPLARQNLRRTTKNWQLTATSATR